MKNTLDHFREEVSLKYNVFNSIFQTLGLDSIHRTGIFLPIFQRYCQEKLNIGLTPVQIVDGFFEEYRNSFDDQNKIDVMFNFIKFIERQIVLIDALEEAAFDKIQDVSGSGSMKSFFDTVQNRGQLKEFKKAIEDFKVRVVLTAHPTQFYPGNVLGIIKNLADAIQQNDISELKTRLSQLGFTPFFNEKKPSPYDEALNLIWFLENLFYNSIPAIYEELSSKMSVNGMEVPDLSESFQLGFWPGGDRDGNPFVTTDISIKVADRLRHSLMRCYFRDVRALKRKLTFRKTEQLILDLEKKLYKAGFQESDVEGFNRHYLLDKLEQLKQILKSDYNSLFLEEVNLLKFKVSTFGFHFATLDFRQDNDFIKQTFDALRAQREKDFEGFNTKDIKDYFAFTKQVERPEFKDSVLQDTIDSFPTIKNIIERNGRKGAHRYIISNCNSARSVARVYILARMLAFKNEIPIDIIPLFETINDLDKAADTMRQLFSNEDYRNHIDYRSGKQIVMLGFSDGTKDGGYITANWSIYKAKETITQVAREFGVKVIFFDGRGGPPARGGGNTHNFYASLGKTIESEEIQLTIQGQTISSKYGSNKSSKFNIEQLYTAGLQNLVFNDQNKRLLNDEDRELLEELSQISGNCYQEFKNDPLFIPYLENCSTLNYYNKTNIGSRPAKRGKTSQLTLKDLRAIPFVGAWSQLKQNVPGFYGVGTAFRELDQKGKLNDLKKLHKNSLFFKNLLENSMQALCKTQFPITQYMENDPVYGSFWRKIHNEYKLSVEYILKIAGVSELLETSPATAESIRLRENIVFPLLIIQQYAMMRVNELKKSKGEIDEVQLANYEKLIVRSLYGNINASRNSA